MKKLMIIVFLFVQAGWLFGQSLPTVYVRHENAKLYKQANYKAEVLLLLKLTDAVKLVRKFNDRWTIVEVNGQPGYVERWNITSKKSRQKNSKEQPTYPTEQISENN